MLAARDERNVVLEKHNKSRVERDDAAAEGVSTD